MNTVTSNVRRKNIDIPEPVFKILSIKAAAAGTNLKRYIESILQREAENIDEKALYAYLCQNDPDGEIPLEDARQEDFERWLGV